MGKLDGKVAVITGAGSGIGQAGAVRFAREGARIVAIDVNEKGLAETEARVKSHGGQIVSCKADVSIAEEVRSAAALAVETFGVVNVLYNNAGLLHARDGSIIDLDEDVWDRVIAVNLKGVYLTCKHLIPAMLASGGGSIINTASISGLRAGGGTAYGASKGGILALTRNVAQQHAPVIRCNSISPGPVETAMTQVALTKAGPKAFSAAGRMPLLGRRGRPEEVAELALFLAADDSSFVTGANFVIDGGMLA